ncbi:MAG: acetyl-CoA carboxylase biotin carboxylase subunit [SAR202 cluster bacterium]|nr:acetyl-CoA carboxylase biotin carboxylase subunit [SAR202 cluster bacterium]
MFSKILIANRGEIACRVIRTCKKMGIPTVAVYSEADSNALHVQMADEAYYIGAAPPSESYLNIVKIIDVAETSGAEAIHPGYGFLSENAAFAVACREVGIKFIGPTPEVVEKMGDKLEARKLAEKAGIPIIPGTNTAVGDRNALKRAKKLGFPLMVKAAAGGGGIGMQIVRSAKELVPILERARHQAENSFGSPRLYFERYLEHASHIEVQILGDEKGNVAHLYERDCSVQRRNQKVLEVAPTIKINGKLRKTLTKNALKLAKHIGYTNAGTVEFLVSSDGEMYFLEMNKRLQVEHGITEMITGIDLVEMQIRIAAGETLPLKQKVIRTHGYAMEARIYAEDPETFFPSAGTITQIKEPKVDDFVRIDGAIYPGYEVSIYYDPLLAKLICWGESREEARSRLAAALSEYQIEGVSTNIPFLHRVISSHEFISGKYDTWLVANLQAEALQGAASENGAGEIDVDERELAAAAAVAMMAAKNGSHNGANGSGGVASPWKIYGRSQQMAVRPMGRAGWR